MRVAHWAVTHYWGKKLRKLRRKWTELIFSQNPLGNLETVKCGGQTGTTRSNGKTSARLQGQYQASLNRVQSAGVRRFTTPGLRHP